MSNVVYLYPNRVKMPEQFNHPTAYVDWVANCGRELAAEGMAVRQLAHDMRDGKVRAETLEVIESTLMLALKLVMQADDIMSYANRELDSVYMELGLTPPGRQ